MKRSRSIRIPSDVGLFRIKLLTLCFFFVIGIVGGWTAHCVVNQSDDLLLREYILQYAQYTTSNGDIAASILSVLGIYFRYPIAIFIISLTSAALYLIPLLIATQAFSIAFSIACFVSALGNKGLTLALAAFGTRYLVLLPVTLLLAVYAMNSSANHVRKGNTDNASKRSQFAPFKYVRTLICFAALLIGAAIELLIVPQLLKLALAGIM